MMMRFKHFLESSPSEEELIWTPQPMSIEEMTEWTGNNALAFINYCNKNAKAIYRGVGIEKEGLFDSNKLNRKAAHTLNYYNQWIDNHSSWNRFPKRSKSLVCSTSLEKADQYGVLMTIIPEDSAKIGICPRSDIWGSFKLAPKILGTGASASDLVDVIRSILYHTQGKSDGTDSDWSRFSEAIDKIGVTEIEQYTKNNSRNHRNESVHDFENWMKENNIFEFRNALDVIFDPKKNGFSHTTAANFIAKSDKEVWVQGKSLIVDPSTFDKIRNAF